jgi:carbamate kinase
MGPKVQAACEFADATGHAACIGALEDTARMLRGEAGTTVVKDETETEYWPRKG